MDSFDTQVNSTLAPQTTNENPNLNTDSSTKSGKNILLVSNEKSIKRKKSAKRPRRSSPVPIKRQKKKSKVDEEYVPPSFKRGKKKRMRKTVKKFSDSAETKEK